MPTFTCFQRGKWLRIYLVYMFKRVISVHLFKHFHKFQVCLHFQSCVSLVPYTSSNFLFWAPKFYFFSTYIKDKDIPILVFSFLGAKRKDSSYRIPKQQENRWIHTNPSASFNLFSTHIFTVQGCKHSSVLIFKL